MKIQECSKVEISHSFAPYTTCIILLIIVELNNITLCVTVGYNEPYLLVFTECCIEVYHVPTAHWIQNISIRKVLSSSFTLLCIYSWLSCRQEIFIKMAVSYSSVKEPFHLHICVNTERKVFNISCNFPIYCGPF